MNTEKELAWLAGIMEGEGTFSIYHQKTNTKGAVNGCLRATVSVTNCDPYLINECFRIFKNMGIELFMHQYDNKKGSTRTVYDLQTSKQTYVKIICETLLPYLVGEKKPKAEMLLRFVTKRIENIKNGKNGPATPYDVEDWAQFHSFRSPQTTRETPKGEDIVGLV